MNIKESAIAFLLLILACQDILSQCSDAGVCIVGRNSARTIEEYNSFASLSYIYGRSGTGQRGAYGDDDINYHAFKLEGEIEAFEKSRIGFSLPYSVQSGPLGTAHGLGDLSLYWQYLMPFQRKGVICIIIGGKFASGNVNTNDLLPQSYQSGLGTNDLLLGIAYTYESFILGAVYQNPFGRSENYITGLKRGDDLLLRAGYDQTFKKLNVKAEMLAILRLQESSVQNPLSVSEDFINIDGSNEVQINLTGQATYKLTGNIYLQGMAAIPLLKRDYNFDGLRRSFTVSASAMYLFNLE